MILPGKLNGHHKKLRGHHQQLVVSVIPDYGLGNLSPLKLGDLPLVAENVHLYRPHIMISVDVLHHCGSLMIPDAHRKDMVSFPLSGSAPDLLWNLPMMMRLMNSPAD